MRLALVLLVAALFAFGAQAQSYKWIDKDGKVRYGDVPPPGVKATPMRAPASGTPAPAPAPAAQAGKAASKGPLTPAEQEQEYRKRKEEAAKAGDEAERARKEQAAKKENCDRAQEYLRTVESGQRMQRVNAAGERYFLDDAQREQEAAKARQSVQESCK
jgi:uncharacterized protein DUF4124